MEGKNLGVTAAQTDPNNWTVGSESGVIYTVVMNMGWSDYDPGFENQAAGGFDDMSCVTHSLLNVIRTQLNFLITQDAHIHQILQQKGYINAQGKVDFDDQFIAIVSGTTPQGNDGSKVIAAVKNIGLVPAGTINKRGTNVNQYLDSSLVTDAMRAQASTFWSDLGLVLLYEWIPVQTSGLPALLAYHVKQAPLQLYVNICPGYNSSNPINSCPIAPPQHAIQLPEVDTLYRIFDSEVPNLKNLVETYPISACLKAVVTKVPQPPSKPVYAFHSDLETGSTGQDVVALQNVLIFEGFLNAHLNTGYFGQNTFNALCKWQLAHSVQVLVPAHLTAPTGYFGAYSRAYANSIYSA